MKKQNVKVSDLKIVAMNNLEGKSGGIKWPFNKIIDALLTRKINVWKNNCQDDIEKLRIIINEIFNQYFNDIFTHINISEFIDIS